MSKSLNFFLRAFMIAYSLGWTINVSQENLEEFFYAQISRPFLKISSVNVSPQEHRLRPDLEVEAALSLKINKYGKEKLILRKNDEKPLAIASLSKLMTGLIVLENTPQDDFNLEKTITVSEKAASQNDVPVYGNLKQGEVFTVRKLLELMLAFSSNDAAFSLSEIITNDSFVEKMNQRAKELGLENTFFMNSTGLDPKDPNQIPNYSNIEDLITLTKYILENHPLIFELSLSQDPYLAQNGLSDLVLVPNQWLVGGKTGYTEKAGGCMILIMQDENRNHFINVILGSDSPTSRIQEMQKLINWLNT